MRQSGNDTANSAIGGAPNLLPNLAKLLDNACREFDDDRGVAKAFLTRAASLLRVELERQAIDVVLGDRGTLVGWQIHRLNAYIEARLDRPIRLTDLSSVSKLSTAYFCRAFKQTFRETAHTYVVRRRLERAGTLMLTSDLPLSDIAQSCGFSDQAHLCKAFRRHHGITPSVWRRERTDRTAQRLKIAQDCSDAGECRL